MDQDELPFGHSLGLLLERNDGYPVRDRVGSPNDGKPRLIEATRPEISRDRKEMWISEERLKIRVQIRLYRSSAPRSFTDGLGAKEAEP